MYAFLYMVSSYFRYFSNRFNYFYSTGFPRYSRVLFSLEICAYQNQQLRPALFSLVICYPMFSGPRIAKTENSKTANNEGHLYLLQASYFRS